MSSSLITALEAALLPGRSPTAKIPGAPQATLTIENLTLSAASYLLGRFLATTEAASNVRLFVICADEDTAIDLHQNLRSILSLCGADPFLADYLPGWEHSPYSGLAPSPAARFKRLRALGRIHNESTRSPKILVVDAISCAQKTINPKEFNARCFSLRPGDYISREDLVLKLTEAGYVERDPVEDPGTFAFRGHVFDVYSALYRLPIRIEFFGDEIEKIRFFDPKSQRSAEDAPLDLAELIPASEWTLNAESVARAKSKLKEFCDTHNIPKKARDLINERLDLGTRDPWFDYLLPFFSHEPTASIFEHLNESWQVCVFDRMKTDFTLDKLESEYAADYNTKLEERGIVAPFNELYLSQRQMHEVLASRVTVALSPIGGTADHEHALHRVIRADLETNLDLQTPKKAKSSPIQNIEEEAPKWLSAQQRCYLICTTQSQCERALYLLTQHDIPARIIKSDFPLLTQESLDQKRSVGIVQGALSEGFRLKNEAIVIVTEDELFGPKKQKNRKKIERQDEDTSAFLSSLEELEAEDYVVHHTHGIGRYKGLFNLEIDRIPQDFLLLEYAGGDKLYLPVYRIDLVQKFIGPKEGVSLERLGSAQFEKTKAKVKAELQELANELLELYAKRQSRQGFAFSPPAELYREFEAKFPYAETVDQLKAIEDIEHDMGSGQIMDRLVCGDVGYGKTEVAMRAAFRAVIDKKQVAVLVPTTILALQHERTFCERFKDSPVAIRAVSRMKTQKEIRETLAQTAAGNVDILIGTHRLLSKDIAFKDLGLLIVDEFHEYTSLESARARAS